MKTPMILLFALAGTAAALAIEEKTVTPVLESVSLFKNGLAVVRATFPVSGPGLYRWEKVPRAVYGSFWIESDGKVAVQSTTRLLDSTDETESPSGQLQKDLAGKQVMVTLKASGAGQPQEITGTVWEIPKRASTKSWNADYASLNPSVSPYYDYRYQLNPGSQAAAPNPGNFLVLDDADKSRRYIDQSSVAAVTVTGPFGPAKRSEERPVLVFDVQQPPSNGGVVRVTYLTKGLAWLPSYQVDLTDPKTLKIRQSAVIRNEMADLGDAEIHLISGYPNVRFGTVDSPMWPGTGLASFFQQINQSGAPSGGQLGNMTSQQMVYSNSGSSNASVPLPESSEVGNISDDIHYESIGKRSLKAGDSLSLDIAAAQAAYERVVEWVVPDPRDANGRYQRNSGTEKPREDLPWDAVRFSNPFQFPMTTASAMVMEGGRFRGQSLSEWVNPGQSNCLRITRALSIHTESSEVEEEGKRENVWIGGNQYQRTKVTGRLAVRNFRGREATVIVRCQFSGELLDADESPEKSLRSEGVYSVNPRRQLEWTIKLPAGQEKILNYHCSVLAN